MASFALAGCGELETTTIQTEELSENDGRSGSEEARTMPAASAIEQPAREGTADPPLGRSTPGQAGPSSPGPQRPPE